MLTSFSIRNFRLFQAIKVKRLSQVNLVVGKNNSGKSAFLEAVRVYASNASASVIVGLVESRQETWASGGGASVRHLFFGHSLPDLDGEGIALGEATSPSNLHLTIAAYKIEREADDTTNLVRLKGLGEEGGLSGVDIYLVAEDRGRTRRILNINRDLEPRPVDSYTERKPKCPWQFVPAGNMENRKIAALWDLTSLSNLKEEVISALQLIEPRVEGVAFVEDLTGRFRSDERVPLVKLKGMRDPLPLKNLGDGMTRLFQIIVSLANAQGGILLIDEFENGLHWSVQPAVWDVIFRVAERLRVQVFATTHSRDCIQGFDQAWSNRVDQGAFFRLDLKGETVRVREYTAETLTDALETEVEVR